MGADPEIRHLHPVSELDDAAAPYAGLSWPAIAIRTSKCRASDVLDCDDGKFMNHSEQPNTDFRVFDKGYALTDIAVGEEITCNYYEFDPAFRGFGPSELPRPGHHRVAGARLLAKRPHQALTIWRVLK